MSALCPDCRAVPCLCDATRCVSCDEAWIFPSLDDVMIECGACGKGPLCERCAEVCEGADCLAPICRDCFNKAHLLGIQQLCRDCWGEDRRDTIRMKVQGLI